MSKDRIGKTQKERLHRKQVFGMQECTITKIRKTKRVEKKISDSLINRCVIARNNN